MLDQLTVLAIEIMHISPKMVLDRINQRPRRIIASPDDLDFDEKVQAAIRQKLEAARSRNNQQANNSNAADG
jgi:hypothetical protein